MKTDRVLGIMSGTSLDGVDYALCEIGPKGILLRGLWSRAYPKALHLKLLKAASDQLTSYETAQLHHDLGRFYAQSAPAARFDYVGLHGQTIFHNPDKNGPATYQIGEPAYLAARFKKPVINQFRTMDLALGGQGAPLATLFHREVFSMRGHAVAVNNLGGISNVTYLPPLKTGGKIFSFDTGPANMLIDYAVNKITRGRKAFDEGGALAERGVANLHLVHRWMQHSYFKARPPKSTGREDFGEKYFMKVWNEMGRSRLSDYDRVATLTAFTAEALAAAYVKFLPRFPEIVVLCGGGASNPVLVDGIRRSLREIQWRSHEAGAGRTKSFEPVSVTVSDALGWPSQSIEAAAFALLAYRTRHALHGNLPATTGARRPAILGQITPAP